MALTISASIHAAAEADDAVERHYFPQLVPAAWTSVGMALTISVSIFTI
jgi:hypothetical protein